jgi:H+-translocating NAD(P) transhydrogenase subunit alpha
VVITTAQVPGRRPPLLVTEDALKAMTAGSVIVDMGASDLGGNVAGSRPGETVVTEHGVTIIGASGLPSSMPAAASAMYARNVSALLLLLVKDGELALDPEDELQAGVIVTRDGAVVHPALAPRDPAGAPGASAAQEAAESAPAGSEEGSASAVPGAAS